MERDLEHLKEAARSFPQIRGAVFGVLRADGHLDLEAMAQLTARARPLEVTCHRAFDMCRDASRALSELVDLGIERVLTSGQGPAAPQAVDVLKRLIDLAEDRVIVMPGAGITPDNACALLGATGAREFHATAWTRRPTGMLFRQSRVFMGGPDEDEFDGQVVDPAVVQALCGAAVESIKEHDAVPQRSRSTLQRPDSPE